MPNDALRAELIRLRTEDLRVRQELVDAGELGGSYVPRMEALHTHNAERHEQMVGQDGAKAAWFIVQHAIGFPDLQRKCLQLLQDAASQGRVPRWHAAYLEDRIAMQEGWPQRYGTQWMDDPFDGRVRPWSLADAERINDLRAEVGIGPLQPVPERGPELSAEQQQAIQTNQRWWEDWFVSKRLAIEGDTF